MNDVKIVVWAEGATKCIVTKRVPAGEVPAPLADAGTDDKPLAQLYPLRLRVKRGSKIHLKTDTDEMTINVRNSGKLKVLS